MPYHHVYYRCNHRVRTLAYGSIAERSIYLKEISRYDCPDCEVKNWDCPAAFLYFLEDRDECIVYVYHCAKYRAQLRASLRGYKHTKFSDYLPVGANGDDVIDSKGWYKFVSPTIKVGRELQFLADLGFRNIHSNGFPPEIINNLRVLNHTAAA